MQVRVTISCSYFEHLLEAQARITPWEVSIHMSSMSCFPCACSGGRPTCKGSSLPHSSDPTRRCEHTFALDGAHVRPIASTSLNFIFESTQANDGQEIPHPGRYSCPSLPMLSFRFCSCFSTGVTGSPTLICRPMPRSLKKARLPHEGEHSLASILTSISTLPLKHRRAFLAMRSMMSSVGNK